MPTEARLAAVAVPELNDDHAEQLRLLDAAVDALDAAAGGRGRDGAVLAAVDAYYGHSRAHFAREEERLRDAAYPELAGHAAEHERALAALDAEERRFRDDGDAEGLRSFLLEQHLGWLERHVATADVHAGRYLAEWSA